MAKILYLINKENELNWLIKILSELKTDMSEMNDDMQKNLED